MKRTTPCLDCGWLGCKQTGTWACFHRTYKQTVEEYYWQSGHLRDLRYSVVEVILVPTWDLGRTVQYSPQWAVFACVARQRQLSDLMRAYGWESHNEFTRWLSVENTRHAPPPDLHERLDRLKVYAVLRGWAWAP